MHMRHQKAGPLMRCARCADVVEWQVGCNLCPPCFRAVTRAAEMRALEELIGLVNPESRAHRRLTEIARRLMPQQVGTDGPREESKR